MISATLNTDFTGKSADMIDDKINSGKDESNFTIFDDRYQKSILRSGASGKLGTAMHSNRVVFNALLQQMAIKPRLIEGYDNNNEIPFSMTIGNFTSDGTLGSTEPLKPNKEMKGFTNMTVTQITMEDQNSSVDNQKLLIMAKRNENKFTIGVLGLIEDLSIIKDRLDNGEEISLPSLFISQPIIRRYVELKEKFSSITGGYVEDAENKITNTLKQEFGKGVNFL